MQIEEAKKHKFEIVKTDSGSSSKDSSVLNRLSSGIWSMFSG